MNFPPRIAHIIRQVAAETGVEAAKLVEPSSQCRRFRNIVTARHIAVGRCWELRRQDGSRAFSMAQIGGLFGGRDHTTILNSIRRYEATQPAIRRAA